MAKQSLKIIEQKGNRTLNQFIINSKELDDLTETLKSQRQDVETVVYQLFNKDGTKNNDKPDNFIIEADVGTIECQLQKRKANSPLKGDDLNFVKNFDIKITTTDETTGYKVSTELEKMFNLHPEFITEVNKFILDYSKTNFGTLENAIETVTSEKKNVANDETIGSVYHWSNEKEVEENELITALKRVSSLNLSPVLKVSDEQT